MIITNRDLELFSDLYDMRILSAGQIKRTYFNNSNYGYTRIKQLERKGYLNSKALIKNRRKHTQYYYLTTQSASMVQTQNTRQATRNRIDNKYLVERQLLINEVYTTLKYYNKTSLNNKTTWLWEDSRKTKRNYNFNSRDLIAGTLISTISNQKYGIYIPAIKSKLQDTQKLLTLIENEINRHQHITNNIILCTNPTLFNLYRHMKPVNNRLHILPFIEGLNLIHNLFDSYKDNLKTLYSTQLKINPNLITPEPDIFATHTTRNYHLSELITNDITKLPLIKRYAKDSRKTKPLNLLCWDTQISILQQLNLVNHPKIILTFLTWADNYLLNTPDYNKAYAKQPIQKSESEKTTNISISLTNDMLNILDDCLEISKPKQTRSSFIQKAIKSTPEYQKIYKKREGEHLQC